MRLQAGFKSSLVVSQALYCFITSWVLSDRKTFREKRDPIRKRFSELLSEHVSPEPFFCRLPAKAHIAEEPKNNGDFDWVVVFAMRYVVYIFRWCFCFKLGYCFKPNQALKSKPPFKYFERDRYNRWLELQCVIWHKFHKQKTPD